MRRLLNNLPCGGSKARKEAELSDFNKDRRLAHYRELNRAEDDLWVQGRPEEAESIHRRLLELEQEAMEHGYILTVSCLSALCYPDTEICWIQEMTPEERQLFQDEGRRAVYDALSEIEKRGTYGF